MTTLAEIRAKLLEQEAAQSGKNRPGGGDNIVFPHWSIDEGTSATLRFLPDADETNTYFWQERQMIKLEFPGVKGQDENKSVLVQVPCVEMWKEQCPVHAEIRPWFKDPSMEDMARKYWKKRSYIFQGFVTQTEMTEENAPESPIRRFVISPQIYKIISAALMDPEFPEIPTDYEQGTDFKITKGKKGQYADYGTSNWARRERSLNQEERDAIETHGLYKLNDFLPKKPDAAHLKAIHEMFEASVDGQLYDPDRFSGFYRPWGVEAPNTGPRTTAPAETTATPEVSPATPQPELATVTAAPESKPANAQDILAMIRQRKDTE